MNHLRIVETLVAAVAADTIPADVALDVLAKVRLNADPEQLSEAVTQLRAREGIKDGSISPLAFLDESPHMGFDSFQAAITEADKRYVWAIGCLAKAVEVGA